VFQAPGGQYNIFFTGTNKSKERGLIQRVGRATGETLFEFTQKDFVLEADADKYERLDQNDLEGSAKTLEWKEEGWRDPWVFFDERDNLWHMLVTARLKGGKSLNRGTVGHAVSSDLEMWSIKEPLAGPTGFAQLEVFQIVKVEDKYVVVFCAAAADIDPDSGRAQVSATYSAPCDSPTGPFYFDRAEIIDDGKHYAGRVVQDTDGVFKLLGFENGGPEGFTGIISDPLPLTLNSAGVFKTI
jgi:beta-fructofuranosidase